jgi:hypothetical protein
MDGLDVTLQIRSCGYHDTDQWSDLKPGVNYLSGKYEIREKPAFEPGWYYLAHTGEHLEFRFCRNHEPTHFPGDWHLVTEEKLERVFGYDVEEGWDD